MTVAAVNVRLSEIEQTWQAASASERLGYLDELAEMAGTPRTSDGTAGGGRTMVDPAPAPRRTAHEPGPGRC